MSMPTPRTTLIPYTTLFRSKGRKERYIPIGQYALDALQTYIHDGRKKLVNKSKINNNIVFLNHRGYPLTTSGVRSEEHTSELQSRGHLVCRLLLEKKKNIMV